jgi:hypothetical protein
VGAATCRMKKPGLWLVTQAGFSEKTCAGVMVGSLKSWYLASA